MNTNTKGVNGRPSRRASRLGRAGPVGALLMAAGLLVAACGGDNAGPGVAAIESSTTTQPGSAGSSGNDQRPSSPDAAGYSKCMRDHGVPGFPDPNAEGEIAVDASALGIDPESAQYQAAEDACASLLPRPSAEQQQENYEARLRYAQCMRDQGISAFPDPNPPSNGPDVNRQEAGQQQDLGFDPDSPVFKAADEACKHLLPPSPTGDNGPSTNSGGAG
jgi:hypothetical protein